MGDTGHYRSASSQHRWHDGKGIAVVIATQDNAARTPGGKRYVRVLRAEPGDVAPTGASTSKGGTEAWAAEDERIDLFKLTLEVTRDPDEEFPPPDYGQGEAILLNRDQAVELRLALDAFISDAVVLLPAEQRAEDIAEKIRSTGDLFARPEGQ